MQPGLLEAIGRREPLVTSTSPQAQALCGFPGHVVDGVDHGEVGGHTDDVNGGLQGGASAGAQAPRAGDLALFGRGHGREQGPRLVLGDFNQKNAYDMFINKMTTSKPDFTSAISLTTLCPTRFLLLGHDMLKGNFLKHELSFLTTVKVQNDSFLLEIIISFTPSKYNKEKYALV